MLNHFQQITNILSLDFTRSQADKDAFARTQTELPWRAVHGAHLSWSQGSPHPRALLLPARSAHSSTLRLSTHQKPSGEGGWWWWLEGFPILTNIRGGL